LALLFTDGRYIAAHIMHTHGILFRVIVRTGPNASTRTIGPTQTSDLSNN
jgi:hypothetical protein